MRTPWGDEVVAGHYAGHPGLVYRQRPRTFAELLFGVDRWAERTFLVQGDRRITFGEFFTAIDAARDMMVPLGIQPGDRVLLLAYNSPDWVVALWAIWSLGAVPVLGNRWWSGSEAAHSIAAVTPRAAITDAVDLLATADLPILDITVLDGCVGGARGGVPAIGGQTGEEAPAVVLFTSGSTGMPKAVELSFRSLVANQQNVLARSRALPHPDNIARRR